jgi:hypothetical protein
MVDCRPAAFASLALFVCACADVSDVVPHPSVALPQSAEGLRLVLSPTVSDNGAPGEGYAYGVRRALATGFREAFARSHDLTRSDGLRLELDYVGLDWTGYRFKRTELILNFRARVRRADGKETCRTEGSVDAGNRYSAALDGYGIRDVVAAGIARLYEAIVEDCFADEGYTLRSLPSAAGIPSGFTRKPMISKSPSVRTSRTAMNESAARARRSTLFLASAGTLRRSRTN